MVGVVVKEENIKEECNHVKILRGIKGGDMRLVDADKLYDDLIDDFDDWLKSRDYDMYCCVGDAIREVIDRQKSYSVTILDGKK